MENMGYYTEEERQIRLRDKKIYVPDRDELCLMQEMGANVYKYLYVKAIELLTLEGLKISKKGILNCDYKYILEDPNIVRAVCRMYPEEILRSPIAKDDVDLCLDVISDKDSSIYNLDNLTKFNPEILQGMYLAKKVVEMLYLKLKLNPKYRFEYIPNSLLDSIFSGHITDEGFYDKVMLQQLSIVEPAYLVTTEVDYGIDRVGLLRSSVSDYASRYGIDSYFGEEYRGKDIFTNPDEKVKRLFKTIKKRYDYIYEQPLIRK